MARSRSIATFDGTFCSGRTSGQVRLVLHAAGPPQLPLVKRSLIGTVLRERQLARRPEPGNAAGDQAERTRMVGCSKRACTRPNEAWALGGDVVPERPAYFAQEQTLASVSAAASSGLRSI
jgi:hypothetical protein